VLPSALAAQTSPSPSQSPSPSAGSTPTASSGTYSIEAEILAYKSLDTNSKVIVDDVNAVTSAQGIGSAPAQTPSISAGVVVVPSVSTILPAFQVWRSNLVVVQNFLTQADVIRGKAEQQGAGHALDATDNQGSAPSFATSVTAASQVVTTIQSLLALFATNQSVNDLTGTIQDQALITAVSRRLRIKGVTVLAPDVFAPFNIADIDPQTFPFIKDLTALVDAHGKLQDIYQRNLIDSTTFGQLQTAESGREADAIKLADPAITEDKAAPIRTDADNLTGQITSLRGRLGFKEEDPVDHNPPTHHQTAAKSIDDSEADIVQQFATLKVVPQAAKTSATAAEKKQIDDFNKKLAASKTAALAAIKTDDANITAV
jgi:hypothetical protein